MGQFLNPPFIISILIALAVHEWAHGFVAYKLGDHTARLEGRLTLNPIAHLDPMGTIMFFIIGFGWAKPVPVNPLAFKHQKRDTMLVALAGPVSNLILASIAFAILVLINGSGVGGSAFGLLGTVSGENFVLVVLEKILLSSIFINLALMAFNLLPIAPLDGSKVLRAFIPPQYEMDYEHFMQRGPMILLILIVLGMVFNIPILSTWVFGIMTPILGLMNSIAGVF